MKKSLIYIILIIFGALIAFIILGDAFKNDLTKETKNPYAYDLGDIKKVNPALIKFHETKRIALVFDLPRAIDYRAGYLGIAFANHLQLIDTLGREYFSKPIAGPATCIALSDDMEIFLGCKSRLEKYNSLGELLVEWEIGDTSTYITSLAIRNDHVYVANAGRPAVHRYSLSGEFIDSFDGKNRRDDSHGFIIPSPYFDLDIDPDDQLWAANTGVQSLENYNNDGSLRAYWGGSSYDISGFIGCCNPAQFTILTDGSFVTSEKGLVRIKVYHPSGELDCVVATPKDFEADSEAPDLTSDEFNNIYALDITRKMIRKFERKES